MGLIEPNDGTLQIIPKPGEVRNPLGFNNPPGRKRNGEIRAALFGEMNRLCDIEGCEHLTQFEYGIRTLVYLWMAGDRWAMKFCADRMFGRVPFSIEMDLDVTQHNALENLSDAELAASMEAIARTLREKDAVLVEQGPVPVWNRPTDPQTLTHE